jgi:CubicO group peptidase (beta-lactamase class C family)
MVMAMASTPSLDPVQSILTAYVDRGVLPGVVAVVERNGQTSWTVDGAQSNGGLPMRRDSIFRLDSVTKVLAATGAMVLVDDGLLRLDEPIDGWVPELARRLVLRRIDGRLDDLVPADRSITTRDLLTMRMGLGYIMEPSRDWPVQRAIDASGLMQGPPRPNRVPPPETWLARLASLPLLQQPGERWMYDISMNVLGLLMERASGTSLPAFLEQRLFAPLGMRDTAFHVPTEKWSRFTSAYVVEEDGALKLHDAAEESAWAAPVFPSAASGLVSTAEDLLPFARMLLGDGQHAGRSIVSAESVRAMARDEIPAEQKARSPFFPGFWDARGWGLGVSIVTGRLNEAPPGRFGWDGAIGTSLYVDPAAKTLGILLTQRMDFRGVEDVNGAFWREAYRG